MAAVMAGEVAAGPVQDERDIAFRTAQTRPQERQERKFDQPRRFSSTIAFPPRSRSAASAAPVSGCSPVRCPRMSSISTRWSGRPSTRRASLTIGNAGCSRRAAWRSRRAAPRRTARRARRRRRARRSGDRPRLVGAVVLLVDDYQPQVLDRREHRRARPDADPGLTFPQAPPLARSAGSESSASEGPRRLAEACDETSRRSAASARSRGPARSPPGPAERSSAARRYTSVLPEPVTPWSNRCMRPCSFVPAAGARARSAGRRRARGARRGRTDGAVAGGDRAAFAAAEPAWRPRAPAPARARGQGRAVLRSEPSPAPLARVRAAGP